MLPRSGPKGRQGLQNWEPPQYRVCASEYQNLLGDLKEPLVLGTDFPMGKIQ